MYLLLSVGDLLVVKMSSALAENISGVSIGAALHKGMINIPEAKRISASHGIDVVKSVESNAEEVFNSSLFMVRSLALSIMGWEMQSLVNAFNCIGANVLVSSSTEDLSNCDLLALPGVGAFPAGMEQLQRRGARFCKHGPVTVNLCWASALGCKCFPVK